MSANLPPVPWHSQDISEVATQLKTRLDTGLSAAEAQTRLAQHGPNELRERPPTPFWKLVVAQLNNFIVILLIVAAVVSALLGDVIEAVVIMAIVVLNAILGVIQENRAEKALAALKKMAAPEAEAIRDGHRVRISSRELVPGDVVLIEAGNYVPADLRLVESVNLKIDEASLTGESVAVEKIATDALLPDVPLSDRRNAAYMSTLVTYGRGKGVVIGTGMNTQMGMIASMLQSVEEEQTPLQKKLDQLGKTLGIAALIICGMVFAVYTLRALADPAVDLGTAVVDAFLISVSLAIAAVPEGLPAIVTITLAIGMREMIKRHALIRKLAAVETLGSATMICSDKTGTLTQNEMTAVKLWVHHAEVDISGQGYQPEGNFTHNDRDLDVLSDVEVGGLLWAAALVNDAQLEETGAIEGKTTYRMVGDPTEGALIVAAAKAGLWRSDIEQNYPRAAEVPFDSDRKRMSTIHELRHPTMDDASPMTSADRGYVVCLKGAAGGLLERSTHVLHRKGPQPIEEHDLREIREASSRMASQALRVLGVAYRKLDQLPEKITAEEIEHDLIFVGLIGMIDPARPEVKPAIEHARQAGIRTVMITGDHPDTARAIAGQIGLLRADAEVHAGVEIDPLSDDALKEVVAKTDVFARVSPAHKVRIVEAFRARDEIVAMTGDGVNDAPALKRADIGVAMGITGTDVSKETADMVLTDDNYVSIVSAVEQGRIIYGNIRKFVFYLLSCNVAEIAIIFIAALAGWTTPLTPIQLLWLNLLTDGAPALALATEKGDPDIMRQRPRPKSEPIINRLMVIRIAVMTVALTSVVLLAYQIGLRTSVALAETMAFVTLALAELPIAYTSRSERYPLFKLGFFSNRWMQAAVGLSIVLTLAVLYIPFFNRPFNTVPLTLDEWIIIVPLILIPAAVAEISKFFVRRSEKRNA
ncbi:MAG TPA: cation-translocating P-type ATPase [Anaerolineae bacterium]|nr:cation-translocating P-type ATPase [Anaerolineae bacterium]